MLAGELYDASDPELLEARIRCRMLCREFNQSSASDFAARKKILEELLCAKTDVFIEPNFYCDYGWNIHLGSKVYFNFNCVVLDVLPVTLGDNVLIGPSVQIYTAMHPISAIERRGGLEFGKPVNIGSDVWIGGGAIICPGVTIGDRSIVGAGSVVTSDVPQDVIAVGNPARMLKGLK